MEQRGYNLLTIKEYQELLSDYGFVNIKAQDKTDFFIEYTNEELNKFIENKEEFIKVNFIFFFLMIYKITIIYKNSNFR